jgi:hypothetical protein
MNIEQLYIHYDNNTIFRIYFRIVFVHIQLYIHYDNNSTIYTDYDLLQCNHKRADTQIPKSMRNLLFTFN